MRGRRAGGGALAADIGGAYEVLAALIGSGAGEGKSKARGRVLASTP